MLFVWCYVSLCVNVYCHRVTNPFAVNKYIITSRKTRIKSNNTQALSASLYGTENWNIKARDARRIKAAETKHMRKSVGYTWKEYKTNTETAKELNITPVLDKIQEYIRNLFQHTNKRPHNRLPRILKTTDQQAEETIKESFRRMRPERVYKWLSSMLAM